MLDRDWDYRFVGRSGVGIMVARVHSSALGGVLTEKETFI